MMDDSGMMSDALRPRHASAKIMWFCAMATEGSKKNGTGQRFGLR